MIILAWCLRTNSKSSGKKSKNSGALEYWKLFRRCEFLLTRSNYNKESVRIVQLAYVALRCNRRINIRDGVKDTRLAAKHRPCRGQGQGPRTKTQVFSKKKTKKGLQKFFLGDLKKKVFKKVFRAKKVSKNFFGRSLLEETKKRSLQIFRLVSGVFQRNFNGSKIVLSSSREQGNLRGLEASRKRSRTSKCVLEAKDVLEDSTFDKYAIQQ